MSSSDFLSQDEVDALLRGVSGEGETTTATSDADDNVRSYNLGTQERIVRGRMPTLELIHERFSRLMRIGIFNFMHRSCEVTAGPVKVQKYGDFMRNLVVPTNLNLIQAKPLRGTGLIVFDPTLVFLVVDNLFGGTGRFHTRVEGREFSSTEQRIIRGLLDVVFQEMARAWKPIFKLEFDYLRSEMNSQFANIATPSEIVVTTTFAIEIGEADAAMHLCLPYSMIEPIRGLLYSTLQSDHVTQDKRWLRVMTRQLETAEVELVCNLGSSTLTLRDVIDMQVDDVIPIEVGERIHASVDGIPVLEGHYGVRKGQFALKVVQFLASAEEDNQIDGD